MFTTSDDKARLRSLRLHPGRVNHAALMLEDTHGLSLPQAAVRLKSALRKNYRDGYLLKAELRISYGYYEIKPGYSGTADVLSARMKKLLGDDARFTITLRRYTHIIPAEDEHDNMVLVPAFAASIDLIPRQPC